MSGSVGYRLVSAAIGGLPIIDAVLDRLGLPALLEQVLPARLGGSPGDYQLIEREGAAQTNVELRVSPRVRGSSAEKIRACFLEEIRLVYGGSLAGRVWRHAEALEVVLAEPVITRSGKVNPLHLLGQSATR